MSDDAFGGKPGVEQLTAFQRWELASFDPIPTLSPEQAQSLRQAEQTQQELARQKAYDEGYAAGQQAGYSSGAQQTQMEIAKLQTLMQNLQIALNQTDEQLAQSLLDLSLEVARKMIVEALKIKPELILKIVSSAISNLPHFNQNAHLILHPSDAILVQEHLGENLQHGGWKLFTDDKIEPGGCRIETAHSNIDATNQNRWQNIVESIGQDKSWLTTQT